MCCGHRRHQRGGQHGCDCDCGEYSQFGPAFWTNEEKVAWLEKYLKSLKEDGTLPGR